MIRYPLRNNVLNIESFKAEDTALFIVDLVNGFCKTGPLAGERGAGIIPGISELLRSCVFKGIRCLAFADAKQANVEMDSFSESEKDLVDEIRDIGGYQFIEKHSTNAFHEPEFRIWLDANIGIKNFIITGGFTDICVMQLAISLKTWFDSLGIQKRVIIPSELTNTYSVGAHNGDEMHHAALLMMQNIGIEVIKNIK